MYTNSYSIVEVSILMMADIVVTVINILCDDHQSRSFKKTTIGLSLAVLFLGMSSFTSALL